MGQDSSLGHGGGGADRGGHTGGDRKRDRDQDLEPWSGAALGRSSHHGL